MICSDTFGPFEYERNGFGGKRKVGGYRMS